MHFKLSFVIRLVAVTVILSGTSLRAEDWKTTDGKTYQNVQVVKAEPDAVTIVHQEGSARVPMEKLSPDLQKRYNYDPDKAQAAREARQAQTEAEQQQAQAQQMAQAAIDAQNATTAPTSAPTTPSSGTTTPARTHSTMDDLLDSTRCLTEDFGPNHASMSSLLESTHRLATAPLDPTHHSMDELGGRL